MNSKLGLACVLFASACVPPSATMATEGTMRAPQGSTSGAAALGYIGDYPLANTGGLAGGARVSHQIVRNVALAGEAGFGGYFPAPDGSTAVAGGGRVSTRVSPDSDHFAVIGGLGGGAVNVGAGAVNVGAGFFSADIGVRVGWNYQRRLELFAGQSFGVGVVLATRSPGDTAPGAYFHSVTELGILGRPSERVSLGASLSMMGTLTSEGRWFTLRPAFVPGVFVGYTFGGR